jgi:hypothetical protein
MVIVRSAIEYQLYICTAGNSRPQKGNNFSDKRLFARMKFAHKSVQGCRYSRVACLEKSINIVSYYVFFRAPGFHPCTYHTATVKVKEE